MGRSLIAAGIALGFALLHIGCGGGTLAGGGAGTSGGSAGAGGSVVLTGMGGGVAPPARAAGATRLPTVRTAHTSRGVAAELPHRARRVGDDEQSRLCHGLRQYVQWRKSRSTRNHRNNARHRRLRQLGTRAVRRRDRRAAQSPRSSCGCGPTRRGSPMRWPTARPPAATWRLRTRTAVATATGFLAGQTTASRSFVVLGAPGCIAGAMNPLAYDSAATVSEIRAASNAGLPDVRRRARDNGRSGAVSLLTMAAAGRPYGCFAATSSGNLQSVLRSLVSDNEGWCLRAPPPTNQLASQDYHHEPGPLQVPRDTTHVDGWDFVGTRSPPSQLYGTACERRQGEPHPAPGDQFLCPPHLMNRPYQPLARGGGRLSAGPPELPDGSGNGCPRDAAGSPRRDAPP